MSIALAIYGSHNASISLAIHGKIVEVLEVERVVGKKNASLFSYPHTSIEHTQEFLNWVKDRFWRLYGAERYDVVYREAMGNEEFEYMLRTTFPAALYSGFNHHINHAGATFYQSNHQEAIVLSFDGGGDNGWFNMYHCVRGGIPIQTPEILCEKVNYGIAYSAVGHFLSVIRHEEKFDIGNLVYSGKIMALAGFGRVRDEWMDEFNAWYSLHRRPAIEQQITKRKPWILPRDNVGHRGKCRVENHRSGLRRTWGFFRP